MQQRRRFERYDYRSGVKCAVGVSRGYQPREGGPPLLFATDIRMTILVHLALAPRTVRIGWLWKHLGGKHPTALYPLAERGLIMKWKLGRKTFVALDPCHPAAEPLRAMLVAVGKRYGFKPMPIDVDADDGGPVPTRPSRWRDVRDTFGDRNRTLPLLIVLVLNTAVVIDIVRVVPYLDKTAVRNILYMYRAFGILETKRVVAHKRRGVGFSFSETYWLVPHIRDVLKALDHAMPQWRAIAERQAATQTPRRHEYRERRKHGRWKWL
jgi:hypothetical protein